MLLRSNLSLRHQLHSPQEPQTLLQTPIPFVPNQLRNQPSILLPVTISKNSRQRLFTHWASRAMMLHCCPGECCCEETCRKRSGIWKRKSRIWRVSGKHEQPNRECLVDSTSAIVTLSELVFIFRLAKSITILPGHFDVMPAIIVILYSSIVFFSLF